MLNLLSQDNALPNHVQRVHVGTGCDEQIFDDIGDLASPLCNEVDHLDAAGTEIARVLTEYLGESEHGGERRADLVTDRSKELVLGKDESSSSRVACARSQNDPIMAAAVWSTLRSSLLQSRSTT